MNLKTIFPYGSNAFFNANHQISNGERVCDYCGKIFKPKPKSRKTARFCSLSCSGNVVGIAQLKSLPKQPINPEKHRDVICKSCGKKFSVYKSSSWPNKYCSRKCVEADPDFRKKIVQTRMSKSQPHIYSRSKRGWRTIGGKRCFFRSRMEANYARYMSLMGVTWEYEPKTFWFEDIRRGVRSYTPDFYLPDVDRYVECKGWMDKRSATKLKRMKKYYPKVIVELITYDRYKQIAKVAKTIIKDWEADK